MEWSWDGRTFYTSAIPRHMICLLRSCPDQPRVESTRLADGWGSFGLGDLVLEQAYAAARSVRSTRQGRVFELLTSHFWEALSPTCRHACIYACTNICMSVAA